MSLREAQKDASPLAMKQLLKEVFVSQSLENLRVISRSQLAKHVLILHYTPDLLPLLKSTIPD